MIKVHVKAQNVASGDVLKLTPEMGVRSLSHKSKSPYRRIIKRWAYMERDIYNVYFVVRDYENGLTMVKVPQDSRVVVKRPQYNLTK